MAVCLAASPQTKGVYYASFADEYRTIIERSVVERPFVGGFRPSSVHRNGGGGDIFRSRHSRRAPDQYRHARIYNRPRDLRRFHYIFENTFAVAFLINSIKRA